MRPVDGSCPFESSRDVLHDLAFTVPEPAGETSLRAAQRVMARWSNGTEHGVRRAIATTTIDTFDLDVLRTNARRLTHAQLGSATDLVEVARLVPVAVIAEALGFEEPILAAHHQRIVTTAIAPEDGQPIPTDDLVEASLAWLIEATRAPSVEIAANRVALLHQCLDATAGLIALASLRWINLDAATRTGLGPDPAAALVAWATAHNPPVRHTTRISPKGELTVVPLTGRPDQTALSFGAGPHQCPGADAAHALAAGVVDAIVVSGVLDSFDATKPVDYENRTNLLIPRIPLPTDHRAATKR